MVGRTTTTTRKIPRPRLLLVDDDSEFLEVAAAMLGGDFDCVATADPARTLEHCGELDPDAVLLDLYFDRQPVGFEVLSDLMREYPLVPVIMWTDDESYAAALRAQELGAFHHVPKTAQPRDVASVVAAALKLRRTLISARSFQEKEDKREGDLLAVSEVMRDILAQVDRLAPSDHSVLITGETGVGKGLLAREIHRRSNRSGGPFVVVECAALPPSVIENELFGHEKGAYTSAASRQIGSCETADRGTLFLDEIGDMPTPSQAKLLRLADEGTFKRLGGTRERHIDTRIIAATNRDLEQDVIDGRFRQDLYYRLNTFQLRIPPLRERRDDVPHLAAAFAARSQPDSERGCAISQDALAFLTAQDWPGNIRQLMHTVERASLMAGGNTIELQHVTPRNRPVRNPVVYARAKEQVLSQFNRAFIIEALARNGGKVTRAAEEAKISRETFYRLMRKSGLRPEK